MFLFGEEGKKNKKYLIIRNPKLDLKYLQSMITLKKKKSISNLAPKIIWAHIKNHGQIIQVLLWDPWEPPGSWFESRLGQEMFTFISLIENFNPFNDYTNN